MSASEYLPLYQSFTNRTHIRNGRRFDQSEISQIIEKNICCSVILSGLIQLKSIPRTEYIVLSYNIRPLTLWTPSGDTIPAGKGVVKCDTQLWTPLNFEQTVRPNPNLACDRRQISITPRRLYVIILRTFVIPPSTPFNLNDVESGSRRSAFRSQHEGVLPCTVWYTPIATSDDGQKCPTCAEVCYDRVSTNLQPFDSKGSKTRPLNLSLTIE